MIWLTILGYFGKVKSILFAYPWQALLCLSLLWGVYEHRQANKWHEKYTKYVNDAQAAKKAEEAKSEVKANVAQENYTKLVSGGSDRVRAYSLANRVRTESDRGEAESSNPDVLTVPTSEAILAELDKITITYRDMKVCDTNYAYAQAAFEWAQGINK
jgi:hypothetical protein